MRPISQLDEVTLSKAAACFSFRVEGEGERALRQRVGAEPGVGRDCGGGLEIDVRVK